MTKIAVWYNRHNVHPKTNHLDSAKFQKAYGTSYAYVITLITLLMALNCNVWRIAHSFV